jgi:thioredoxin
MKNAPKAQAKTRACDCACSPCGSAFSKVVLLLLALSALLFWWGKPANGDPNAEKAKKDSKAKTKVVITEITGAESFKTRVLKAKGVVFVKFYADWCGWCHKFTPIVKKVAGELQGKLAFVQIDTDKHGAIAGKYGVRGLPTSLVFKDGKMVEKVVGFRKEDALLKILKKHIKKAAEKK